MSVFGVLLVRIFTAFSRIRTEYGEILRIQSEYGEILRIQSECRKMWENADQRNSEYGHFLRSETRVSFLFFEILDKENVFELEWFKQNGKILNLHKYQTIIIDKRRSNLRNIHLN